ncbi:hypothetical protein DYB32_007829 [Aphanomyces invadans]|uniref:Cysteine/serine-rich nuclear protein N-terminal domain-containing protein n=1 Tax=Aphanomyces invadans TaxID=157072 RepID=A0A418AXY8_9STRA|nr:hypothetical protein DYB32_007829 [Aphanomyces invadans]
MELLQTAAMTTAAERLKQDADDASPTHVEALFEVTPPRAPSSRVVTFTTATTYVFNVAYGGSALPKKSGPPIGMADIHIDEFHEDLRDELYQLQTSDVEHKRRRRVRKFDHLERIDMLKRAKYHVRDIATFCMDAIDIRKSRQESLHQFRREVYQADVADDEDTPRDDEGHKADDTEDTMMNAMHELKRLRPPMFEPPCHSLQP